LVCGILLGGFFCGKAARRAAAAGAVLKLAGGNCAVLP